MVASRLNTKLGKHGEALGCAEKALQVEKDCIGTDHEDYQKTLEIVRGLKDAGKSSATK